MKICHIISGLNTGGAEMMLYKLLSTKNLKHFDHAVVSLKDEGTIAEHIKELGVPVFCLGMSPRKPTPIGGWRLVKLIKQFRPDIIQGWMYYGSIAASIGAALTPRSRTVLWDIRHTVNHIKQEKRLTAMAFG